MLFKKIDFLLLFELPNRELESCLLLQDELRTKGYNVKCIKFPFSHPIYIRLKYRNRVRVILTHSLYDENVLFNLVYNMFGPVNKIVNMQVEQIRTNNWENNKNSYMFPKTITKNAKHICWGKRITNLLMKNGLEKNNLITAGAIHLDFIRNDFANYYIPRNQLLDEFGIDSSKKIILFISSFGYATLNENTRNELICKLGEKYVNGFVDISISSRTKILNWIEQILNDEIVFIYRPHPTELLKKDLINLQSKYTNFKIIDNYTIKQWILCVDKIYTWFSTSVAEAYYANKSINVIRPIEIPKEYDCRIFKDVHFITSVEELKVSLNATTINNFPYLEEYYTIHKDTSCKILVDFLIKYLNDKSDNFLWNKDILNKYRKMYFKSVITDFIFIFVHIIDYIIFMLYKFMGIKIFSGKRLKKIIAQNNKKNREREMIGYILNQKKKVKKIVIKVNDYEYK